MIKFVLIVNRLGQIRVAKFYDPVRNEEREHVQAEIIKLCLTRSEQQCSFVEYRNCKLIYDRRGSLCIILGVDDRENELACLELIDTFVKVLNKCFDRLNDDLVLQNLEYIYLVLDEMISHGRVVETNTSKIIGAVKLFNHTVT